MIDADGERSSDDPTVPSAQHVERLRSAGVGRDAVVAVVLGPSGTAGLAVDTPNGRVVAVDPDGPRLVGAVERDLGPRC